MRPKKLFTIEANPPRILLRKIPRNKRVKVGRIALDQFGTLADRGCWYVDDPNDVQLFSWTKGPWKGFTTFARAKIELVEFFEKRLKTASENLEYVSKLKPRNTKQFEKCYVLVKHKRGK